MIDVLGFREDDVDKAIALLKNELKKLVLSDDWSNSPLREWIPHLNEAEVRCMYFHVHIYTCVYIFNFTLWKTLK